MKVSQLHCGTMMQWEEWLMRYLITQTRSITNCQEMRVENWRGAFFRRSRREVGTSVESVVRLVWISYAGLLTGSLKM